ncbi:hypothetical protein Tco_0488317 [Tanacetum coccineum]
MHDDLFTYKVGILGLSYPLYDEPQCDNLENYDLGVHEWNVCYDEVQKSYVEVVIFFNKRLARLIDVIMEQWIDLNYKQQFNDYMEINRKRDVYEHDTNMEYDPSNVEFTEWLASKFCNHSMMDWYTKNALWMYWIRGDDEEVFTNEDFSNLEETNTCEEIEIAEIFRIETNIFHFETPLCKAFEEYKAAWMYECTEDVPWEDHEPWKEPAAEGLIDEDGESSDDAWSHYSPIDEREDFERNNDNETIQDKKEPKDEDDDIGYLDDYLVCNDAPFIINEEEEQYKERMCKLLEEYVATKEYGYDDWIRTEENVSHVYQDIFHKKDKGWSQYGEPSDRLNELGDAYFMELYKICNNDKNLSEIQLEHEKEDELVAVVVKVVHECRHWMVDFMMVVKEIENGLLEEVEKLECWFEQGINDEGEEDEEDGGGDEV